MVAIDTIAAADAPGSERLALEKVWLGAETIRECYRRTRGPARYRWGVTARMLRDAARVLREALREYGGLDEVAPAVMFAAVAADDCAWRLERRPHYRRWKSLAHRILAHASIALERRIPSTRADKAARVRATVPR